MAATLRGFSTACLPERLRRRIPRKSGNSARPRTAKPQVMIVEKHTDRIVPCLVELWCKPAGAVNAWEDAHPQSNAGNHQDSAPFIGACAIPNLTKR